jgi:RND family efflux transporter MFP subunit
MNSSPPDLTQTARVLPGSTATATVPSIKLGRMAWIALVVVLIAAAAGIIPRWRQRAALRVETAELAVSSVVVTTPAPGKPGESLSLPAEVKPFIESPIYARASGYLKRWLVDIGAKVEAGQLLAEIDTPELNQELARARAEVAQAEAALALAKITAARWGDLLKTSSVSEQETAEKQSDLALKTANLDAARASVHRLEDLQGFAQVTAPFAGVITARKTDVGELIVAGSGKELFRLAQTGTLRVYVPVPQSAARAVEAGQAAELSIPELPGRHFIGKVVRTAGAMDASSRTLLTEVQVDNSRGEILAGSYAEVQFPESGQAPALTLPSNTLLFRAEGTQVAVVKDDGSVELRNIRIGRDLGPTMEILEGVTATDHVIVNPPDSIATGFKVRVGEGPGSPAPAAMAASPAKK